MTLLLRLYYRKNMAMATCFRGDPRPALIEFAAGVLAASSSAFLNSSPSDRVPAAGQRPRGRTPSPPNPSAAPWQRRSRACSATRTGRWRGRATHRRLGTRARPLNRNWSTVPHGYSRPGGGILPSIGAHSARPFLLLRTRAAPGQSRRAESFPRLVQTIADLTGVSVSKRSLKQILPDAARTSTRSTGSVRRSPPPAPSWLAAVIARDFHGQAAQPTPRLTKGQKANKKRMATVAAVFTCMPWARTPQQVVESLFRISCPSPEDTPVPLRPEAQRGMGQSAQRQTAVIQEAAEEMVHLDPVASNPRGPDRRRASATQFESPEA